MGERARRRVSSNPQQAATRGLGLTSQLSERSQAAVKAEARQTAERRGRSIAAACFALGAITGMQVGNTDTHSSKKLS